MLKQRIVTAIILIPIILLLLFFSTPLVFLIFTAVLTLAAGWEWSHLVGLKTYQGRVGYLLLLSLFLFGALFIPIELILFISVIWWFFAMLSVVLYPRARWISNTRIVRSLMGLIALVPFWVALNYIRQQSDGIYSLLFLLLIIWGADTAAYFAGKKWGTIKLAPTVSPGKSLQGAVGAFIFTSLLVVLFMAIAKIPTFIWPWGIALTLITVLFSIVGDLFESMLKREIGLKDSGCLLPGHGGLLDRIDSLIAAAPIFAAGALLLGELLAH